MVPDDSRLRVERRRPWDRSVPGSALAHTPRPRHSPGQRSGQTRPLTVGHRWWVLAVVAIAPFLVVLEDHAMAIALPSLGRDLDLGIAGLAWVVNAYTVTAAVLTLGGGVLADRFGTRPVFLAGLALFVGPSLIAGLSTSGAMLIGMRAAQGTGAALMGPAALAILVTSFSGPARGLALGVWSAVVAGATASGPLLGALLTESVGWRSIFLLNVPLGVAALITAGVTLPVSPSASRRARVDAAGVVASAVGLSALVFALTQGSSYGWTSVRIWGLLGVAAAAFAIFAGVERRAPAPLLDRFLFRLPNFLAANTLSFLNVAALCSLVFFLSLYLQLGPGLSAVQAGVALLPLTVVVVVAAPLAGWLVSRVCARLLSGIGLALVAAGMALLGRIDPGWGPVDLLPGLLLAGLGIGLAGTPVTTAGMQHAPAERSGVAGATLNASGMVGMSLGITAMGAIVAARSPTDPTGSRADTAAFAAGLGTGFVVNAALALIAAVVAVVAIRSAGTRRPAAAPAPLPAARANSGRTREDV